MQSRQSDQAPLDRQTSAFYRDALGKLAESQVPFLIGGAYGCTHYTGIPHHNKDLDTVVRPQDCPRALQALASAGYQTELTFPHWLGKVFCGADYIDVMFNSGNGIAKVDDAWFEHAVAGEFLGVPVALCSPVEMIWSKAFVMERERYDGADIIHLLRCCRSTLDWARLLHRFGPYWEVLLSHLILFGFVFPSERSCIPQWIMKELLRRLERATRNGPADRLCRGTLLSRAQYLVDIEQSGYEDARLSPSGHMTRDEIARWTAAIECPAPSAPNIRTTVTTRKPQH